VADRQANGRFATGNQAAKGNKGGRPKRATEEAYLRAFSEACPTDKWLQVLDKTVKEALSGEAWAVRFLADYLAGKPPETLDLLLSEGVLVEVTERIRVPVECEDDTSSD